MLNRSRIFRFLLTGLVNTGFGLGIYVAAMLAGAPDWLALMIAVVAGVVFNFFSTGHVVFNNRQLSRFPMFVLSYAVIYWTNLALIRWISGPVGGEIVAQLILCLPMAACSYCLLSLFVFPAKDGLPRENSTR